MYFDHASLQLYDRTLKLMDNRFQLSVVADDGAWANDCIDAGVNEIKRIKKLLTTFNEESETAQINELAGICPVIASEKTFDLIGRSMRISRITQGAFDIK